MYAIFLTHRHEARYPSNPNTDLQIGYGNSLPTYWYSQEQEAKQMASHYCVQASETSRQHFDSHTFPIKYTNGQLVWLNEFNFLERNRKLSPTWSEPYPIIKIVHGSVVVTKKTY
jgi:hypothetical protein